jgi:hypothetical protein
LGRRRYGSSLIGAWVGLLLIFVVFLLLVGLGVLLRYLAP